MLLVFLTVSVMLLGTIQAQHIGELCFRTCELLPWLAWGPCDSTCGGTRWRERKVCCEQDWSPTTCGIKCHLTLSDVIETAACRLNCVFGVSLGSQCRCEDHGYGRCCQFSNLKCSDNPCKNNATCVNRDRRYECQCTSGWFGPNCGVDHLTCSDNPCKNNAVCISRDRGYECRCTSGWSGPNCTVGHLTCSDNPCKNNAVCFNRDRGYECQCTSGWSGPNCTVEVPMATSGNAVVTAASVAAGIAVIILLAVL